MESLAMHHYVPQCSMRPQWASRFSFWSCACSGCTATSGDGRRTATELLLYDTLDFDAQRVERVELVQSGLRADAVRVLRGLNRLEQELDLVWGEIERAVDDLFHLNVSIDRAFDHFVCVCD